jgi:hypothetical protein
VIYYSSIQASFALEKVSGTDGVINIHGQIAADAQDGKLGSGFAFGGNRSRHDEPRKG